MLIKHEDYYAQQNKKIFCNGTLAFNDRSVHN